MYEPDISLPPLIDTHAHLDWEDYSDDLDEVISRARAAGLVSIITIGIEPADWARTLEIASLFRGVSPALGIHPNSADQASEEALAQLASLARSREGKRIVALGETGLDYYREHVAHDIQQQAFRAHLDLARQLDLPVIIHNRDAHEDILRILKSDGSGTRGIMHSFSGDLGFAEECLALGYMISLAGPVTFRKAVDKHLVARGVPLDRLLVETDCPFLTPEPFRGRRNEPSYVKYTAEAIAALRQVPYDEVARATTANAREMFGLHTGQTLA